MRKIISFIVLIFILILPGQILAKFSCQTLATDIEVLYLYDEVAFIDWPLVYHLAGEKNCRVNLVSLETSHENRCETEASKEYNIFSYQFTAKEFSGFDFDSVLASINSWRLPDIVILDRNLHNSVSMDFSAYLLAKNYDETQVFNIEKVLRGVSDGEGEIFINSNLYMSDYFDKIDQLANDFHSNLDEFDRTKIYSTYSILRDNTSGNKRPSFLSGINRNRLEQICESEIKNRMVGVSMKAAMSEYLVNISAADDLDGLKKINRIFDALEFLYRLKQEYYSDINSDSTSISAKYISSLINSVSSKIIELAGISFDYRSMLRDTPQGAKLKIVEEINNNGPLKIMAGKLMLKPNWNNNSYELPLEQKDIAPFGPLVREWTLEAGIESLVTFEPDSILVIGTIRYRGRNLEYKAYAEAYMETPLKITLQPNFTLMMPVSHKKLDRLIEPVSLRAVITKPSYKAVTANIQIKAPSGTKTGAYQKSISMPIGMRSMEVSIPLVATKSLSSVRKPLIVNLVDNKFIIASDTAYIGRADSEFNENLKIALLSGSDGLLEDILVNTGANYRTISNRYLETKDLDRFDILALGTGCYQNYPTLMTVQGKLKNFMEHGGTILVFGQPRDWPADLLPVSILSTEKLLPGNQLTVAEQEHPIFNKTQPSKFLEYIHTRYKSYPAKVSPSKSIVFLDENISMLTESKFKKGKLIYCGLPLLKMFENLDFVAITLFTGLINYSGK